MFLFLTGIAILVFGYFTYGRLLEKILAPDDRPTPAVSKADGVDYVVLPHWKNMLIQLLNIAGVGPVIGVIIGIKFGTVAFLIIPAGNIIAGAAHDFISGMMSLRGGGANLPKIISDNLGKNVSHVFSWFMCLMLLLVVAVFINIPANLCDGMILPESSQFWYCVVAIFIYYIAATLFPVDKIIGAVYPLFGLALLIGTFSLFVMLLLRGFQTPALLTESAAFRAQMFTAQDNPILPMLFVTIACGIISGFHATQSPIIARTMSSERQAKSNFYGMMVLEGIVAMIWAAGALAIYNLKPELMQVEAAKVLKPLTTEFLGSWIGGFTVVAVVILAVTSGDTAMRSLRLSLAEMFDIPQKSLHKRIILCLPLIVIVAALLWWSNRDSDSFQNLWRYFAWANQVLAATTLTAGTVWLAVRSKNFLVALAPGCFMTYIVTTYIMWASPGHKQAYGFGLPPATANAIGIMMALAAAAFAFYRVRKLKES